MKMNEFVTKTTLKEVRSSAYNSAQGGKFGAASSSSFESRQKNAYNKGNIVKNYGHSELGRRDMRAQKKAQYMNEESVRSVRKNRFSREDAFSPRGNRRSTSIASGEFRRGNRQGNFSPAGISAIRSNRQYSGNSAQIQSGMAGYHAGAAPSQQSASRFYNVTPKIGQ